MFTGYAGLQRVVVLVMVSSGLLLLAGCGRDKEDANGAGGEAAPRVTVQMDSLPTMPSARFSEPTTMITPEADQTKAAVEASATAEVTATVAVTTTVDITGSAEMTGTGAVTGTGEVTSTETVSATN